MSESTYVPHVASLLDLFSASKPKPLRLYVFARCDVRQLVHVSNCHIISNTERDCVNTTPGVPKYLRHGMNVPSREHGPLFVPLRIYYGIER